jgi:hypothetical protein
MMALCLIRMGVWLVGNEEQAVPIAGEADWFDAWLSRVGYGYTHSADEMRAAINSRLTEPARKADRLGEGGEREALAAEISRVAGCQVGSDRTNRLVDFILSRDPTHTREAEIPRVMSDEAKTGERMLVHFTGKGWLTVTWEDPHGDGGYSVWCVDDDKHGPYPLRGYNEGDDTHWMPLPPSPAALSAGSAQ